MEKQEHMHSVLVVDDNMDIRYLLKKGLEIEGYHVITAENGLDAQEKILKSKETCIILLDLMMPVMDGWQFLEWKKSHKEIAHLPVIVISAVAAEKKPEGVIGFLKKPVSFPQMLEFVSANC